MSDEITAITKVDNGLARYYQQQNSNDYYNDDDIGKFNYYCDDNGFDDDDVVNELEGHNDIDDCMLLEFDDDFPLRQPLKNNESTKQRIFAILKKIYNENMVNDNEPNNIPNFDDAFYKFDKNERMEKHKICRQQCPTIFNAGVWEHAFVDVMAIGLKQNYSYLQNLTDLYSRDRIKYFLQNPNKKKLTVESWVQKAPKHFNDIPNIDEISAESVKSAIKSFENRIVPQFKYDAFIKINDSLEMVAEYIVGAIEFVCNMARSPNQEGLLCPFQFDVGIMFKNAMKPTDKIDFAVDDDDEDALDIVHDNKYNDDDNKDDNGMSDIDIKQRIERNELFYKKSKFEKKDTKRRYLDTLQDLQNIIRKNKSGYNTRNKRVIGLIDRRFINKSDENQHIDDFYMYEAPINCRNIPNEFLNEWFFNSTRSSVLPNIDYKQDAYDAAISVQTDIEQYIKQNDKKLKQWLIDNKNKLDINDDRILKHCYDELRCDGYSEKMNDDNFDEESLIKQVNKHKNIENYQLSLIKHEKFAQYKIGYVYQPKTHKKEKIDNGMDYIVTIKVEKNVYYEIIIHRKDDPIKYIIKQWPKFVHSNNINDEDNEDEKEMDLNKENITSMTNCSGKLLIISFHALQSDEIKCYLYWQQQMQRFFPEDIATVLPKLFDPSFRNNQATNANFAQTEHCQILIESVQNLMKDEKFKQFEAKFSMHSN